MICLLIALLKGYNLVALPPAKIIPFIFNKKNLCERKGTIIFPHMQIFCQNLHMNVYFLTDQCQYDHDQCSEHEHWHLFVQFVRVRPQIP